MHVDHFLIIAYVGPEVALPVVSALAGVVGFLLTVGRAPFRLAAKGFRKITGRDHEAPKAAAPEPVQPPQVP